MMEMWTTGEFEIYRANLASLGKKPILGKKLTKEWFLKQLHAGHSTIEYAEIYIQATVSGTTSSHIVRATKGHPRFVVESHRPDWTGKARPPASTERGIFIKTNPYAWIEMCRQRLCLSSADETRKFFVHCNHVMYQSGSELLKALGEYAMPDCIFRGDVCHQHKSCGMSRHYTEEQK